MNDSQTKACDECGKSSLTLFTYAQGESSLCPKCFELHYRKCDLCENVGPVYGPEYTRTLSGLTKYDYLCAECFSDMKREEEGNG